MKSFEELRKILDDLSFQNDKLKSEIENLESMDYMQQNEELKNSIAVMEDKLAYEIAQKKKYLDLNNRLKEQLTNLMYSQKLDILRYSKKYMYAKYATFETDEVSVLNNMDKFYTNKIEELKNIMAKNHIELVDGIHVKLDEARELLNQAILSQKERLVINKTNFTEALDNNFEKLEKQPPTDEQIMKETANNNVELKLGGRISNILGVLLVLLGVVFGLQYTYVNLLSSDILKSAAAFVLGALFLTAGEFLNRKNRNVFALGITSGGIAILFAATGISFFVLDVLNMYQALGICVLTTAVAFFLSIRYNSQTIANFALIGGFLPIFAIDSQMIPYVMAYFVLLNAFALAVSSQRDWNSVKYISFAFNTLAMGFLILLQSNKVMVNLLYAGINFSLYYFICLIYPIKNEKNINMGTYVVIGLNTLLGCLYIFGIMALGDANGYFGVTAIGLAVFYYGFSRYVDSKLPKNKIATVFLVTALAFSILAVPLQMDEMWLSLVWLIESCIFIILGIYMGDRWYKAIGGITYLLCIGAFVLFDLPTLYSLYSIVKLCVICLGTIAVYISIIRRFKDEPLALEMPENAGMKYYKYLVIFLSLFTLNMVADHVLYNLGIDYDSSFWWHGISFIGISVASAFYMTQSKYLKDRITNMISMFLYVLSVLVCLTINILSESILTTPLPYTIVFVIYNAATLFGIYHFVRLLNRKYQINEQFYALSICIFLLIITMEGLIFQMNFTFNSMIISFVLVGAALFMILYGFRFKAPYVRRFGLTLAIVSIVKFFIIDLMFLATEQRILSYFVLGAALIGISFVYQYFEKKVFIAEEADHIENNSEE